MRTITVAELRQNPTEALTQVEGGETYVVTRHRHPVARLVPYTSESVAIIPPRAGGAARLRERLGDRSYTDEQVTDLLAEMADDR
ncbi:type II toxin-antitoxin system Phd/YefM family antitoxin [Microbacterium betulae]|uniref:Antitoxin n=1 Tax=Microbacterium betulae TaxID=2981139 RepID=A0AA97FIB7_9MICO|nr:type II toxin-antitoxin system Phd/YefM family antitoxin [Microbacterium sp. AB]WOF23223.1 type II toxin-antitoxin system Phd/YefM family antitoxin [Microbacterium sp. AB]